MIKHGLVNAARSKFSSPDFIAPSEALKQVLKNMQPASRLSLFSERVERKEGITRLVLTPAVGLEEVLLGNLVRLLLVRLVLVSSRATSNSNRELARVAQVLQLDGLGESTRQLGGNLATRQQTGYS